MIDRRFLDISLIVEGIADEPEKFEVGTQYIVGEMPIGDFENAEPTQIARYDGEKWNFITPKEASLEVINAETGEILKFDGMLWEAVATLSGGGSGGSSVLIVDDLAQVLTSENERPNDYVLNYCIVDNGINTPKGYEYYAHNNSYYEMLYHGGIYGSTNLPVNSVLAGDNGKYYTFKPTVDDYNHSLIEASEIAVGTLVLNKKCNLFYQYNGKTLELINSNFISADYVGISDIARKWSDTDYWKHFDEIGLYISGDLTGTLMKPNLSYSGWRLNGVTQPLETGVLFASTNHCMLYYYFKKEGYNYFWAPVAFLKKGTVIYDQRTKKVYVSDGTALTEISQEKFITVKDICDVSFFGDGGFIDDYAIGSKCLVHDDSYSDASDNKLGVYIRDDDTYWKKYSDMAYGDKYIVLKEELFSNSNEPCIHEYVNCTGNVYEYSYFSRHNLEAGTTIFNKDNGKIYFYDGTAITSLEKENYSAVNIVTTGTTLPTTATAGDKFINTEELKLYTAITNNSWDYGIKIPKGYMYLNDANKKMYFFDGTNILSLRSQS